VVRSQRRWAEGDVIIGMTGGWEGVRVGGREREREREREKEKESQPYICTQVRVRTHTRTHTHTHAHIHTNINTCTLVCIYTHTHISIYTYKHTHAENRTDWEGDRERWGAGVETQKNVLGVFGGWGRVPFNEPYDPSLSTIYDGA